MVLQTIPGTGCTVLTKATPVDLSYRHKQLQLISPIPGAPGSSVGHPGAPAAPILKNLIGTGFVMQFHLYNMQFPLLFTGDCYFLRSWKNITFLCISSAPRTESCLQLADIFIMDEILILKIFTVSHLSFLLTKGLKPIH